MSMDDRNALAKKLMALPAQIEESERAVLAVEEERRLVAEHLAAKEATLRLDGTLDGKNELTRAAQLREHTGDERQALLTCEMRLKEAQITLRRRHNEMTSACAIARLLAGEGRGEVSK
jgi:hypothetical protein